LKNQIIAIDLDITAVSPCGVGSTLSTNQHSHWARTPTHRSHLENLSSRQPACPRVAHHSRGWQFVRGAGSQGLASHADSIADGCGRASAGTRHSRIRRSHGRGRATLRVAPRRRTLGSAAIASDIAAARLAAGLRSTAAQRRKPGITCAAIRSAAARRRAIS